MTESRKLLIAVDFDGTICADPGPRYPEIGALLPGAKDVLTKLHEAGHTLMLFTLRDVSTGDNKIVTRELALALRFLKDNDMPWFILPRNIQGHHLFYKFPWDLAIDDKVPGGFVGWEFIGRALGLHEHVVVTNSGDSRKENVAGHSRNETSNEGCDDLGSIDRQSVGGLGGDVDPTRQGITAGEGQRDVEEPKGLNNPGCPLHIVDGVVRISDEQRFFQPHVDRSSVAGPHFRCFSAQCIPLQSQRPVCFPEPREGDS